jgi:hypothetical protein
VDLHPRRPDRHTGYRHTFRFRLLGEQTANANGRYMPFDDVTVDFRGVAGRQSLWDAQTRFHLIEFRILNDIH